ncbi:MAG TPA: hypothetical protein VMK12_21610 [Anaeromyxobacteraceae bacterium]|nr:hypothetical protein [Anaeromyxobacteraceae bacterium]
MKRALLVLAAILGPGSAHAADCKISVTRTACSGKETESYTKCNGAKSCDDTKQADSIGACAKEALHACDNVGARQKVTKSKIVTATFDGQPVQDGKNFCAPDRPDFNKCD